MPSIKQKYSPIQSDADQLERFRKQYAEFIDLAAHDLDAPLRKLSIWVDKLTSSPTNQQEYLARVNKGIADMRLIIEQLTILSKLGLEQRKISECELQVIINNAWNELLSEVNEKKATLSVASIPAISGDASQLQLLFKNLFRNAIRFSRPELPPVVSVHAEDPGEEDKVELELGNDIKYILISVTDNGIGFREEDAERIFQPFVRLHGKSAYEGNGIGLAMCKRIIENHNGIIYATSDLDKGSSFKMILPQTIK